MFMLWQENTSTNTKILKRRKSICSNVKALALSLLNEGCVSYNITRNLINGFSSNQIDISEGYLVKQQKMCQKNWIVL